MSQRLLTVEKRVTEITGEGSHRLQMWVSSYQDIDPEIFVWQRRPPNPPNTEDTDEYVNVASAADMEEYPVDNPDAELPPFYRKTSLDILFRSVALMDKSIATIEADIQSLINNLDRLDTSSSDDTLSFSGQVIP